MNVIAAFPVHGNGGHNMIRRTIRKASAVILSALLAAGNLPVYAEDEPVNTDNNEEEILESEEVPAEEPEILESEEEESTLSAEDITFTLPEMLYVPIWSEYDLPYEISGAEITDVEWSSTDPITAAVDMSRGNPVISTHPAGEALITGILRPEGQEPVTAVTHVYVSEWYEAGSLSLQFASPEADSQTVWLRTAGAVSGNSFTVTPADPGIAEVTYIGTGAEGEEYQVTPVSAGITHLVMTVTDPNNAGNTISFSCQDIKVCADEPLADIIITNGFEPVSEIDVRLGEPGMVKIITTPETYDLSRLQITVSDPDMVTVEPWELTAGIYGVHALQNAEGTVTVTFADGDVTASVTVNVTKAFDLPDELQLPCYYPGYDLEFILEDPFDPGYIGWEPTEDPIAYVDWDDDFDPSFYVCTGKPGERVITGNVWVDDETMITEETHVTVTKWFEPEVPGIMFADDGSDPVTFGITAVSAASGHAYTIVPEDETVVSAVSAPDPGNADRQIITVTPNGPGRTILKACLEDPNGTDNILEVPLLDLDVFVMDPNADPEAVELYDTEEQPLTEMTLQAGGQPGFVIVRIVPETILPDRITINSTDNSVAYGTNGPDNMSPYLFRIIPVSEGETEITFGVDGSEVGASVRVVVEAADFSFGQPEMWIPDNYLYPLEAVSNGEKVSVNDVRYESDNDAVRIYIDHEEDQAYVYAGNAGNSAHITGTLLVDGEPAAAYTSEIHVERWYEADRDTIKFTDVNAEPQYVWLKGSEFTGEDCTFRIRNEAIARLEATGQQDAEGRREYRVIPVSAGSTNIEAVTEDPNAPGKEIAARAVYVQVCENVKLQKITVEESTVVMEPDRDWYLHMDLTPDTIDPDRITVTSSDPSLVMIERYGAEGTNFHLRSARDREGAATLTFSEGKIKTTVKVTVRYYIAVDKEWTSLTLTDDEENLSVGEFTITLREHAAGQTPQINVWVEPEDGEEYPADPENMPLVTELVNTGADRYTLRVTPKEEGEYRIAVGCPLDDEGWYTERHLHVHVQAQEQLRWAPWRTEEYETHNWRNNEEVHLETENGDTPDIYYQVVYTADDTEPEGLAETAEELITMNQKYGYALQVQSPYLNGGVMWIRAAAVRQGYRTSEVLRAALRIEPEIGEIWDEEYLQYIQDNGLTLDDIRNTLHVFGIPDEVCYTGDKITFDDIRVWYGTRCLNPDLDYTVKYANNVNPADASAKKHPTVTITGKGEYTKSWAKAFSIVPMPLDQLDEHHVLLHAEVKDAAFVTNSKTKAVTPKITVSLVSPDGKKTALKANTDYTILYYPMNGGHGGDWQDYGEPVTMIPVNVTANYKAVVVPTAGTQKIAGFAMDTESEVFQNYCARWMPMIQVYSNTEDISYLNISGASLTNTKLLKNMKIPYNDGYDENEVIRLFTEGKIQVKIGKQILDMSDYMVYAGDLTAGKNTLELYGMENSGDYSVVGTKYVTFTIAPTLNISSKTAAVTGLKTSVELNEYNYFQLFRENEEGYWDLNLDVLAQDGNGDSVQLKAKDGTVINRDCYDIEVLNYNGRIGKFTLKFIGRPEKGYTGSITKTVKIAAADITALPLNITLRDREPEGGGYTAPYSVSGSKPQIRVTISYPWNPNLELQEGKDYKVTYVNNKTVGGTASVTITGMGFYKGKLTNALTYTVVPADFEHMFEGGSALTAQAPDVVYNAKGKANYFKSLPVIYDGTKALKKGKDYEILETFYTYGEDYYEGGKIVHSREEPIPDGASVPLGAVIHVGMRIRLLNPNYTWNVPEEDCWIHQNYRMVTKAKKISAAKVKVNDGKPVYLGNNWNIVPPIQVTVGKTVLTEDDYVIESVDKNWLIGTAVMVIRGKGEYWGTKKITFKITKTPIN